jgi:hypothetical protein
MNEIRIDYSELERLQGQMARAPEIVREELEAAVTEADLLVLREVQDEWPNASGVSRASMHHVERVAGIHVEGFVGSSLNYVQPVDLGTKPHFPPIDALTDWVASRFNTSSEKQARGIAFAIARKIALRGTKGKRVFPDVLSRLEPQLREIFTRAQDRIGRRLVGA